MALEASGEADWGGGIYRGRKAPDTSVYDALNALVDDEANLFRRGGSAYQSNANVASLAWLTDVYVVAGRRTLAADNAVSPKTYVLAADDVTLGQLTTSGVVSMKTDSRAAVVRGVLVALDVGQVGYIIRYAGSRKSAGYADLSHTLGVTSGSRTVTGSGTAFLANVDPGMFLAVPAGDGGIVKTVNSNTQVTLLDPFPGATATVAAGDWSFNHISEIAPSISTVSLAPAIKHTLAAVAGRLVLGFDNRAYVTGPTDWVLNETLYIDLQDGSNIIGSDSITDTLVLFTTAGVWTVENMAFDAVDDAGNVQWRQQQVTKDLILWDDVGIAAYQGMLVVPGVEDVVLFGVDGSTIPVSTAIRPLYRSYVKAGYRPGPATVHRGHYVLPILNGTTLVDVLVCRLDREGTPWTRWDGHAAGVAFAQRVGSTLRAPKLLAVSNQRIVDLTGCFAPAASNAKDADGTAHSAAIITRDFPTSGTNHPGTVVKARLRYELTDDGDGGTAAPSVALAWTSDQDAGSFTTLSNPILERAGTAGGGVSDGSKYTSWPVGKMRERIRYRITQTGAAGTFVLRSIEQLVRQGRLR